jgi:hypothetical protein
MIPIIPAHKTENENNLTPIIPAHKTEGSGGYGNLQGSQIQMQLREYHTLLRISKYRTDLLINQLNKDCIKSVITPRVVDLYYNHDGVYTLKPSVYTGGKDANGGDEFPVTVY